MIWILLIVMQFKHFVADYLLQGKYMLGKFKDKGWVAPLASHCMVHYVFTFGIAFFIAGVDFTTALDVAILDFCIHFIMDRVKASPKLLGRFQSLSKGEFMGVMESKALCESGLKATEYPVIVDESKKLLEQIESRISSNTYFWWSLGLDQMVHHLTDILVVFIIVGALK